MKHLQISEATYLTHCRWMDYALTQAEAAGKAGDVPIGAVVVNAKSEIITQSSNRKQRDGDPTAHAEILALRETGLLLDNWHLHEYTLYVTLEPCMMCIGAIVQSRLGLLVYGADDPKAGAVRSVLNLSESRCSNHRLPVIAGIRYQACQQQLQNWFNKKRKDSGI